MGNKVKHSPLPWTHSQPGDYGDYDYIIEGDDMRIGTIFGSQPIDQANADMVIKAVNNHAKLISTIKEMLSPMKTRQQQINIWHEAQQLINEIEGK